MGEDLRLFWSRLIRKSWGKGLAHPKHQVLCVLLSRGWLWVRVIDLSSWCCSWCCVHPPPLQAGMCSMAHQSPSLTQAGGCQSAGCWFMWGKYLPLSHSCSLFICSWRRDYKHIRIMSLLDTLLHFTCFPNRCRFLYCWGFFRHTVFKIRIVLESLCTILLKFAMWA